MKHSFPGNPSFAKASKGRLISFEGIDGSGKSTLIKNVGPTLKILGHKVLLTKEPGGTELGKALRQILQMQKGMVCDMSEYLLFAADRAQHFEQLVIPALKAGTFVLADRLADSSLAYQGYGRGLDRDMITSINNWAMQGVAPDLVIYLRLDPALAFKRIVERNETLTSFEKEKIDFWQRVSKGYEEIFASRKNVVTLDATLPQDQLLHLAFNEIKKII